METSRTIAQYKKKRQIQLVVRDRINSICPMNFFRTTDTRDTTDITIWKPGLRVHGPSQEQKKLRTNKDGILSQL